MLSASVCSHPPAICTMRRDEGGASGGPRSASMRVGTRMSVLSLASSSALPPVRPVRWPHWPWLFLPQE